MYPKFTVVIYGCALYTKITLSMVNVRYRTKQHTIAKADIPKKWSTVIIMTIQFSWLVVSEKYESQTGLLFPIYGNIKNVPNHQPDHYNDHKISGSASGSRPNAMPSSACGFSES